MNFNYFINNLFLQDGMVVVAEVSDFESMEIIDFISIYHSIPDTTFQSYKLSSGINKIKYYDGRNFVIFVG